LQAEAKGAYKVHQKGGDGVLKDVTVTLEYAMCTPIQVSVFLEVDASSNYFYV
jgi:hypothetical protein